LFGAARLLALAGGLAPQGLRAARTAALAAFAASVRVVDRVHGGAAHGRAHALPAAAARFADGHEMMLFVAHLAHGRPAGLGDFAHLARRHFEVGVALVARN